MKSNKVFYIIIGVLVLVILLLVVGMGGIVGAALLFRSKPASTNNSPQTGVAGIVSGGTSNTNPDVDSLTNGTTDVTTGTDDGKTVVDQGILVNNEPTGLVIQGFEFTIPEDFGVGFLDDVGPYIYMNDVFQLRMGIKEESNADFKKLCEDPKPLTEKSLAVGGVITSEGRVDNVNGYDIIHFRVDIEGDDCLVFRTKLNDEYSLAGNLIVLSDNVSESDFLKVIATLASSAVKTDKPDTTKEEYLGAKISGSTGEVVTENTIDSGAVAVTYQVSEGFRYRESEEATDKITDYYLTELFDSVYIILMKYEGGAKAYTEEHYLYNGELKTYEKNGRTYYYNEEYEETEDYYSSRVVAATDVGNDWIYIVDLDTARKMGIENITDFFDITVK